jgi:hypothetical protein
MIMIAYGLSSKERKEGRRNPLLTSPAPVAHRGWYPPLPRATLHRVVEYAFRQSVWNFLIWVVSCWVRILFGPVFCLAAPLAVTLVSYFDLMIFDSARSYGRRRCSPFFPVFTLIFLFFLFSLSFGSPEDQAQDCQTPYSAPRPQFLNNFAMTSSRMT